MCKCIKCILIIYTPAIYIHTYWNLTNCMLKGCCIEQHASLSSESNIVRPTEQYWYYSALFQVFHSCWNLGKFTLIEQPCSLLLTSKLLYKRVNKLLLSCMLNLVHTGQRNSLLFVAAWHAYYFNLLASLASFSKLLQQWILNNVVTTL